MSEESPTQERDNQHRRWHALHAEDAVAAVESDDDGGLSAEEAHRRLERFGPNALAEPKRQGQSLLVVGGDPRDRTYENQRHRASGLNLVVAAIVAWNTVYLEHAVQGLRKRGQVIPDELLQHLGSVPRRA